LATGRHGHLERANAWTHIVAATLYATYAIVRPFAFQESDAAGTTVDMLQWASVISLAAMFATSSLYHVCSPVASYSGLMRTADHTAIYINLALGAVLDVAIATNDFASLQWQTVFDPLIAATLTTTYFWVHAAMKPRDELADRAFVELSHIGLFRHFYTDLEHSGLRIVLSALLVLNWILLVPAAFANIDIVPALVWTIGTSCASVLLMLGHGIDYSYVVERSFLSTLKTMPHNGTFIHGTTGNKPPASTDSSCSCCMQCACASKRAGCVMTTHAWWHVFSFVGTTAVVVVREYAVQSLV
jgi:hypothetical protein